MSQQSDLLAVLVDADNVSPSRIGGVLAEIATYGTASVKRVYGDWTKSQLRGWKDAASAHVIQPMQQFDNTTGKNATDSALIIDAMDLLYTRRFQGFCIVSSDSDFTRLASRIREEGVTVYGFGERKTPEAFRNACDQFTYLEVLGVVDEPDAAPSTTSARWSSAALRADAKLVSLLRGSVENASADDGWADLGTVGQLMRKQQPDFDPRNWGYAKLSDLLKAVGLFTIESKPGGMSLRPKASKTTKAATGGTDGEDDAAPDAAAPERASKRAPKKRATPRGSGDEGADAARQDATGTAAASAPADPTGSSDGAVVEAEASAGTAGTGDATASDAGATSRPRKKSTRPTAAERASVRGAAPSAADAESGGAAPASDATPSDAEVTADSSAPRASSGTVSGSRGGRAGRPIEQLTLGAALDAALDAVSNAARGNAASVSADGAESAPDAESGAGEPGAAAPGADETGATASAATRPKRASRGRAKKPTAAPASDASTAPDAPAGAASTVTASTAPADSGSPGSASASASAGSADAGAADAGSAPVDGDGSAPVARKRAPRRASRPGTAAS
ncbi:NYN domain-containing protein [Microbacterium oleivorans]|uniref:NYN domain-containing protein n=1 Tax=Microbacterium oleivorans TaxID=273677 RepID=A0A7D5JCQ1_9MICO|nr:NYN domain-containing protein [Microbacterium oleivorans]QLD11120.1 NYN domain-containing protein [Microbacterium oleivorans]